MFFVPLFTTSNPWDPRRDQKRELSEGIKRGSAATKPTRVGEFAYHKTDNRGNVRTCVLGAACVGLGLVVRSGDVEYIDLGALREMFDPDLLNRLESKYENSFVRFNKRERLANWLLRI